MTATIAAHHRVLADQLDTIVAKLHADLATNAVAPASSFSTERWTTTKVGLPSARTSRASALRQHARFAIANLDLGQDAPAWLIRKRSHLLDDVLRMR